MHTFCYRGKKVRALSFFEAECTNTALPPVVYLYDMISVLGVGELESFNNHDCPILLVEKHLMIWYYWIQGRIVWYID